MATAAPRPAALPPGIRQRRDCNGYQVDMTVDGRRVRRQAPTLQEALAIRAELRTGAGEVAFRWRQKRALEVALPPLGPTLAEVVDWYLGHVERSKRPATAQTTRSAAGRLREYLGDIPALGLQMDDVERFKIFRDRTGHAVAKDIRVLRAALSYAVKAGKLERMPACPIELPEVEARPVEYFTPEELATFYEAAPEHLRALLVVAANTGARNSELRAATWQTVRWDRARIEIHRNPRTGYMGPKGKRRMRVLRLNSRASDALREHQARLAHAGAEDPVFQRDERTGAPWLDPIALARAARQVLESVGLYRRGVRPLHTLRASFATNALAQGIPPQVVAEAGDWADVSTMLRHYAGVREDVVRDFLERLA